MAWVVDGIFTDHQDALDALVGTKRIYGERGGNELHLVVTLEEGSHDAGVVDYLDGGLVGGTEDEYQSRECHHGQEEDGHEYGGDDETFAFHPFEIFTLYDET